jgi:hypothetical protein
MTSYKKLYLQEHYNIQTTSYNYDAPIKIFRYITYLRKTLDRLFERSKPQNKLINRIADKLLEIVADIVTYEEETLDLLSLPLQEIKTRLIIYQRRCL